MNIEEAKEILRLSKKTFLFGTSQIVTEMEAIDTVLNYIETMQSEFDRLEGIEDNTAIFVLYIAIFVLNRNIMCAIIQPN